MRQLGGRKRSKPRFKYISLAIGETPNKGESYGMYQIVKVKVPLYSGRLKELLGPPENRAVGIFWVNFSKYMPNHKGRIAFASLLE
jgi:hypothetical protein